MNPTTQDYVIVASQIAIFLMLWAVLSRLWFTPIAKVLRERRLRSEGAVSEAKVVQVEAERLRAEHEQALAATRTEAQREVQEILKAAEAEHKLIVDAAAADAERVLATARERIAGDVAEAKRSLAGEAGAIARQVAAAIVGRSVQS